MPWSSRLRIAQHRGTFWHKIIYPFAPLLIRIHHIRRRGLPIFGFMLILIGFTGWYTGYTQHMYENCSTRLVRMLGKFGYTFQDLYIEGRTQTTLHDVMDAIDMTQGSSLFTHTPHAVQERLEALPWIAHADVHRNLAGSLHLKILEKKAIALWQHQKQFYLVDESGLIIQKSNLQTPSDASPSAQSDALDHSAALSSQSLQRFSHLPIVIGLDAPAQTPALLAMLAPLSDLQKHITGIVRIHKRRWNIILNHTVTVKLPETQVEVALSRLNFILKGKKLNLCELRSIDLRLPKQMIAEVSKETAQRLNL